MGFLIALVVGLIIVAVLGFLIGSDLADGNFTGRRRK